MQPSEAPLDVQITTALAQDKRTAQEVIDVACFGGRVTLSGRVGSAAAKEAAVAIARDVPGVIAIDDELAVGSGGRR